MLHIMFHLTAACHGLLTDKDQLAIRKIGLDKFVISCVISARLSLR